MRIQIYKTSKVTDRNKKNGVWCESNPQISDFMFQESGSGLFKFSDRSAQNTNLVDYVEILLPIKFRWIPFSGFKEVENVSANQKPGRPSCFPDRPKKKTSQNWLRTLRACFLTCFVEFHSAVSKKKSKMSQPIRSQGGHFVFPIGPKNTNLVEDVEILLPVKFRWIQFSGFR